MVDLRQPTRRFKLARRCVCYGKRGSAYGQGVARKLPQGVRCAHGRQVDQEVADVSKKFLHLCCIAAACSIGTQAFAAGGPLGIDHMLNLDERGIWARPNQLAVQDLSALAVIGGALWEGNDTRLGRTFWKATDAMLLANVSAALAKDVFRRARPIQANNPNDWFGSSSNKSFPSGEVAHITAVVTPFITEYRSEHPAVWALAALPAYVGVARMKSQAHWQTDVLAGMALGGGVGYYMQERDSAWTATMLPHGLTVGFKRSF
jgi:membrane-associated phospholipid phosphatase